MSFMQFKPFGIPASWKFKDPDTGYQYSADSRQRLLVKIIGYRAQNRLPPIEFLPQVLDNYLCALPENAGQCVPLPKMKRGIMATIRGGIALLENWLYDKIVSQEVAETRASICLKCPHNVFPDKGAFTKWVDDMVLVNLGENKRTAYYTKLGNCEVCSCVLNSKIWYGGKIKLPKDEYEKLPEFCWQKKEIDNGK